MAIVRKYVDRYSVYRFAIRLLQCLDECFQREKEGVMFVDTCDEFML